MFTERDGDLIADDGRIQVRFSGNTGGIATVRNLVTGQLIVDREDPVPWRMPVQGRNHRWLVKPNWKHFSTPDALPVAFRFTIDDDGRRAELRWDTTDPGLTLVVRAVPDVGGGIALWPHLIVEEGARPPSQLAYGARGALCRGIWRSAGLPRACRLAHLPPQADRGSRCSISRRLHGRVDAIHGLLH
jgi:hypothetical protein